MPSGTSAGAAGTAGGRGGRVWTTGSTRADSPHRRLARLQPEPAGQQQEIRCKYKCVMRDSGACLASAPTGAVASMPAACPAHAPHAKMRGARVQGCTRCCADRCSRHGLPPSSTHTHTHQTTQGWRGRGRSARPALASAPPARPPRRRSTHAPGRDGTAPGLPRSSPARRPAAAKAGHSSGRCLAAKPGVCLKPPQAASCDRRRAPVQVLACHPAWQGAAPWPPRPQPGRRPACRPGQARRHAMPARPAPRLTSSVRSSSKAAPCRRLTSRRRGGRPAGCRCTATWQASARGICTGRNTGRSSRARSRQ